MQFAARERRLEHVARVHRALGLARADHGVHFVDEDDGLAFVLRDVVEHGLQALLELAAILGARQQRRHVERQHALALERFRHFAVDDALRQAFDDRGLADARLADQHRVVLGAALQDLDRAADFVVAADHRIELARRARSVRSTVYFLSASRWPSASCAVHALRRRAPRRSRFRATCASSRCCARRSADVALCRPAAEQEHLARDELVVELLRFLVGLVQQPASSRPTCTLPSVALHLRQLRHGAVERRLQRLAR